MPMSMTEVFGYEGKQVQPERLPPASATTFPLIWLLGIVIALVMLRLVYELAE